MNAAELMTEDPITVRADATIIEALSALRGAGVRHLPVVDARGALVGMVSDRDLALLATPGGERDRGPLSGFPVSRVMSHPVVCVDPQTDVVEVTEKLLENEIGAVAVLDGLRLVGIISYVDVLRAFPRAVSEVAEQVEGRQAGRRPPRRAGA